MKSYGIAVVGSFVAVVALFSSQHLLVRVAGGLWFLLLLLFLVLVRRYGDHMRDRVHFWLSLIGFVGLMTIILINTADLVPKGGALNGRIEDGVYYLGQPRFEQHVSPFWFFLLAMIEMATFVCLPLGMLFDQPYDKRKH
jgi:hypothetical protein